VTARSTLLTTVASEESERTGVLVVSAWLESHGPPLRVRITGRLGLDADEETSVVVAGAEEASGIVRDWLVRLEGSG
jgi:hypothetical protein